MQEKNLPSTTLHYQIAGNPLNRDTMHAILPVQKIGGSLVDTGILRQEESDLGECRGKHFQRCEALAAYL